MSKILRPVDIDVSKIHIDKLKEKKNPSGVTKQCKISYDYDGSGVKKPLTVRVPLTTVPFGLTIGPKVKEGEPEPKFKKYSLDFNVVGTADLDGFRKKMEQIDNKNIDFVLSQAATWWGKTPSGKPWSRDTVQDSCYGSMIKKTPEEKGDYPERFRMKLPFYNGQPRFKVYDQNNKKIDIGTTSHGDKEGDFEEIAKNWAQQGMQIDAIMEFESLWEVNKKVYCTAKAVQIRVHPPESLPECAFDDPASSADKTSAPKKPVASVKEEEEEEVADAVSKIKVEDDDEEAEEVEEGEEPEEGDEDEDAQ